MRLQRSPDYLVGFQGPLRGRGVEKRQGGKEVREAKEEPHHVFLTPALFLRFMA